MYFQVCYNSAYPQHSAERYMTNGSLVFSYGHIGRLEKLFTDENFIEISVYWFVLPSSFG